MNGLGVNHYTHAHCIIKENLKSHAFAQGKWQNLDLELKSLLNPRLLLPPARDFFFFFLITLAPMTFELIHPTPMSWLLVFNSGKSIPDILSGEGRNRDLSRWKDTHLQ